MSPGNQQWRKLSGGVTVASVLNSKKNVRPNPPLKNEAWKKPKGVVKVLGAFGKKTSQDNSEKLTPNRKLRKAGNAVKAVNSLSNRESHRQIPNTTNHQSPAQKLRKAGNVVKVVNNLSITEKTQQKNKVITTQPSSHKNQQSPVQRLKNAGNVVKVVNKLANGEKTNNVITTQPAQSIQTPEEKLNRAVSVTKVVNTLNRSSNSETALSVSNSADVPRPRSPGILKSNLDVKKQANNVKFSPRNQIKLIEGNSQERAKQRPKDIKKQSKQILNNLNKLSKQGESESDGYHSDCKHESPRKRSKKPYPKRFYLDKSGKSFTKDANGKIVKATNVQAGKNGKVIAESSIQQQQGGVKEVSKGIYGLKEGPPLKNTEARARWSKIGMLMRLSKTLAGNPSLILLTRGRKLNVMGWKALKSAVGVAKMTKNYIEMTKRKKGTIPKGGGVREKNSFDTVDRYRQHATPKRYDPNRESYIHTTQVRWRNYHGCVKLRDQKGVNSNVYLPWNKVVTEPPSYRSMFCKCSWYFGLCRYIIRPPFDVSSRIFRDFSQNCYSRLSCPSIMLISMFCGFYFGTMTFWHIWAVQPMKKMMHLQGVMVRRFTQAFFGEFVASWVHIWRMIFGTSEIKLNTLNSELNGIFLEKKHGPGPLGGNFKPGKMKDKSLERYPKIKVLRLPLTKRESTDSKEKNEEPIKENPKVFKDALKMAKSKVFNGEVIESALRLAMAKREERFRSGNFFLKQSLQLAKTRRHGMEGEKHDEDDIPLFDPNTAPWQKAKLLAFARLKRGKTNWMKARTRLISGEGSDQSFWHRAKNIVFVPKEPKDKKILKTL